MSLSVNVYKEITDYEEKIFLGLSARKLACITIAVVIAIASFFLCTKVIGISIDAAGYVVIFETVPLMALGFVKVKKMPFEKVMAIYLRHKLGKHELPHVTELVIDQFEIEDESSERKSKYAWIFEKQSNEKKRKRRSKDRRKEYNLSGKKGRKTS